MEVELENESLEAKRDSIEVKIEIVLNVVVR